MNKHIVAVIFFVVVVGILTIILGMRAACERNGGVFVRGLFWFECIDR